MKKIPLTQGMFALVDNKDYDFLSKWKWHAHKSLRTYYARGRIRSDRRLVLMHRVILGLGLGKSTDRIVPDHDNKNGLDNRRDNLKMVNRSKNGCNSRFRIDNKSGFRGVSWHSAGERWIANIRRNGVQRYLGLFDSKEAASMAYEMAKSEGL